MMEREYFDKLGPCGKNDFTEEEFATLLQVLILGNY